MQFEKKHDQLLALDFDHTLFDTTLFLNELQKQFAEKFSIEQGDFFESYGRARKEHVPTTTYMPQADQKDLDGLLLEVAEGCGEKMLYPDAKPFIDAHQQSFDIIIVTKGQEALQQAKIRGTGLDSLFTIVTMRKEEEFSPYYGQYKTIYFIDDHTENVDAVKQKYSDIVVYQIMRGEENSYEHHHSASPLADKVVPDLNFTIPVE